MSRKRQKNRLRQPLLALILLTANAPALGQPVGKSKVDLPDQDLVTLEKTINQTEPSDSGPLSNQAEQLARLLFTKNNLSASNRAWALAVKATSEPIRKSAIYNEWASQVEKTDIKHAAKLNELALSVLDKETIKSIRKQDAYRALILFYRSNDQSKADTMQAEYAALMGTKDPKILFRERRICLGCGMG